MERAHAGQPHRVLAPPLRQGHERLGLPLKLPHPRSLEPTLLRHDDLDRDRLAALLARRAHHAPARPLAHDVHGHVVLHHGGRQVLLRCLVSGFGASKGHEEGVVGHLGLEHAEEEGADHEDGGEEDAHGEDDGRRLGRQQVTVGVPIRVHHKHPSAVRHEKGAHIKGAQPIQPREGNSAACVGELLKRVPILLNDTADAGKYL